MSDLTFRWNNNRCLSVGQNRVMLTHAQIKQYCPIKSRDLNAYNPVKPCDKNAYYLTASRDIHALYLIESRDFHAQNESSKWREWSLIFSVNWVSGVFLAILQKEMRKIFCQFFVVFARDASATTLLCHAAYSTILYGLETFETIITRCSEKRCLIRNDGGKTGEYFLGC